MGFIGYKNLTRIEYIAQGYAYEGTPQDWNATIASSINQKTIELYLDGNFINTKSNKIYMDNTLTLMIPYNSVKELFDCATNIYSGTSIVIERGSIKITLQLDSDEMLLNEGIYALSSVVRKEYDVLYVPMDALIKGLGYTYTWDMLTNTATLINDDPESKKIPYSYNYLEIGKKPTMKNQGILGTCWAAASLTALESSLLPEKSYEFAVDHMSMNNSFNLNQYEGGEYSMSIAYLASWQGPVFEKDDPYGDGISDSTLEEVVHVQEAQIIASKDYETIKKMVYKYGGVQSSLYTSLVNSSSSSKYYNKEEAAYCYIGEEKPNHDIVIIGWDDNYSKENFNASIEIDGAFICQNSWGEDFGKDGIFYVSYADSNIGMHSVVYTKVEDTSNYDNIYQSDLCGWVGCMGTEKEYATFANVYTTRGNENLKAVGFYATGIDTSYTVYICTKYEDVNSLNQPLQPVATGKFANAGYYTVVLDQMIPLNKDEKYAVIVEINTPNTKRPVAVEYISDNKTSTVDLTDGEGYIKVGTDKWNSTEQTNLNCNVCLKSYTVNRVSK